MRIARFIRSISLAVLALIPGLTSAAPKIGDPAAPLSVSEWISGSPVEIKPGTNVYVLEFWGTLSPASRSVIPLLNQVHNEFGPRGVVVIAVSGEPGDKIREFLRTHTPPPQYTVAADSKKQTLANHLAAFGQTAIPYTFVIGKDTKVLWHGVPQLGLTNALQQIFAGTYNLDKAIKGDIPRAEMIEFMFKSNKGDPQAKELGQQVLKSRTNSVAGLYELAYRIITDVNNTNRDFSLAKEALDAADRLAGKKTPSLTMARGLLLFEQGEQEKGLATAQEAVDLLKDPREKAIAEKYVATMHERMDASTKRPRFGRPQPPAGKRDNP